MRQGRHGIKVLGLSLIAALGLMALTAAVAQAGEFRLNGTEFKNVPLTEESLTGTVGEGELLVPGLLTLNCTSGDVINSKVFSGGTALAEVLYLGCTVLGNSFCKVYPNEASRNAKTNAGDLTALGKGSLLLMGTSPVKHFLLLEEDGTSFTMVWFSKSTEGCALASNELITGSYVFEVEDALVNQANHSLRPLTQAEIEALYPTDLLSYGNRRAWLDGGLATGHLSGANLNANWTAE